MSESPYRRGLGALDRIPNEAYDNLLGRLRRQRQEAGRRRHVVICEALGRWVSEIEPCLIFRCDDHTFIGIGIEGYAVPFVHPTEIV